MGTPHQPWPAPATHPQYHPRPARLQAQAHAGSHWPVPPKCRLKLQPVVRRLQCRSRSRASSGTAPAPQAASCAPHSAPDCSRGQDKTKAQEVVRARGRGSLYVHGASIWYHAPHTAPKYMPATDCLLPAQMEMRRFACPQLPHSLPPHLCSSPIRSDHPSNHRRWHRPTAGTGAGAGACLARQP